MRAIDDGAAVILTGESGASLQSSTGCFGLGGAHRGTSVEACLAAETLSAIEVEQNHLVTEFAPAGDRPGAAALGVSRMAARNDDLERLGG